MIHPRLLSSLRRFYPTLCDIQTNTPALDVYGQPIASWADLAGHTDIPCQIAPAGGREVKLPGQVYTVASHRIALAGTYTSIVPAMRVTSGGATYDVLAVEHDSQGIATTLTCQVVT